VIDPVIRLPDPSLVVLVGAAGAGKSTFAARWFAPGEILSSDAFRERIAGDARDQSATRPAFTALHSALSRRLRQGRMTVVDATNIETHARRALIRRAEAVGVPAIAIVLDLPGTLVLARNAVRSERIVPSDIVRAHLAILARALERGSLDAEGFARVVRLRDAASVERLRVVRIDAGSAEEGMPDPV
jgi:predicted kinase